MVLIAKRATERPPMTISAVYVHERSEAVNIYYCQEFQTVGANDATN